MSTWYVRIEGIHCPHCIVTIRRALLKNQQIQGVQIQNNIAEIAYQEPLKKEQLIQLIDEAGYITKESYISTKRKDVVKRVPSRELLYIIVILLFIAFLFQQLFGFNIFNMIPQIDSSISYGMLIVTGGLTSIHCISMCGAINLAATYDSNRVRSLRKPILYNLGRILSYTIIGGIVGALGNVLSLNANISGIIILIAAAAMFVMSLAMMGFLDFRFSITCRLPGRTKLYGSNAFVIGLMNGLMPCGPLQAMQLYALSTGSALQGAISMFLFGMGTVPLMLFMGLIVNLVSNKRRMLINNVAAVFIFLISLVMINRGLLAFGIDLLPSNSSNYSEYKIATIKEEYQEVKIDLSYAGYEDIIVQKGIPVHFVIQAKQGDITGCNNAVQSRELEFASDLVQGDNVIVFTPSKEGAYVYTCWMNMLKNTILVVDDINNLNK